MVHDNRPEQPEEKAQDSPRKVSAYQAMAQELRQAVLAGEYGEDDQMPTEEELVQSLGVSRHTVRRAYQVLVAEGTVYRVPGRGTFPNRNAQQYLHHFGSIEELMGLSRETAFQLIDPLARQVDVVAASRLRSDSDVVGTLRFRRLHQSDVFCVTEVYLPMDYAALLEDAPELTEKGEISHITVIGLLDSRLSQPIMQAEQSVTAVMATEELAAMLDCRSGTPLLRIDRLYLNEASTPVELAVSHFVPELYSYRLKLRRGPQTS